MAKSFIDEGVFLAAMKAEINAEMIKAAEPVIQAAMIEVEKNMRKRLAEYLLARLEHHVDFRTCTDRLVIEIYRTEKDSV